MKDFYLSDCSTHENQNIVSSFVVANKQIKAKKSGEPYLDLLLCDRSGQIAAKVWDGVVEIMETFEQDDFVKVKGLLNKYNGRFQLTVHKLRKLEENEVDFSDYLPKTTKDVEALWKTVGGFVASFKNPHLKALLECFMGDAEIATGYKQAPAA